MLSRSKHRREYVADRIVASLNEPANDPREATIPERATTETGPGRAPVHQALVTWGLIAAFVAVPVAIYLYMVSA